VVEIYEATLSRIRCGVKVTRIGGHEFLEVPRLDTAAVGDAVVIGQFTDYLLTGTTC
jgi:hypothetical protein